MKFTCTSITPPLSTNQRHTASRAFHWFCALLGFLWLCPTSAFLQAKPKATTSFHSNTSVVFTDGPKYTPIDVSAIEALIGKKVVSVAKGNGLPAGPLSLENSEHTLALAFDGTVYSWGNGRYGQLGSETYYSATPLQVLGLSGIKAIAAGGYHSLAIGADGSVYAWGLNASGQIE
ncbi:RCC1 domain-containing protein [Rufibacter tibetensis]|uniref:RCC1 repeat-containing protein n=1 Tax=Rufibacter tibetensis TaxID=512763 RepID=A0A0P0C182_9BACT|nr:hypothetical protein [Rufibacter tibetensis]ALI98330.1 hypothetical protein DC20_04185 [Rufibacter tibetensis]